MAATSASHGPHALLAEMEGIGSAVVRLLQDDHPGRRLVAFSEGAEGFWSSVGWDRYEHRRTHRHDRGECWCLTWSPTPPAGSSAT